MRSRPASVTTDDVRGACRTVVFIGLIFDVLIGRLDCFGLVLAGWAAVNLIDLGLIAVRKYVGARL
jgi:hypothetical protein